MAKEGVVVNKCVIDPELLRILVCPLCKSEVSLAGETLVCTNAECRSNFPIIDSIPIMLAPGTKHHEQQKRYFDIEFKSYDKYRLENWRRGYINRIFPALNIGNNKDDLYLDIGVGGSGYTVIEAARRGCKAVGIDISLEGIKKAKYFALSQLGEENNMCSFVVCIAENLPFKGNSYTQISSVAVLEHVPDDDVAIAEIARVTKPRGKVFITVPNTYKRILPIFALPRYIHDKPVGHLRHYKAEDLIAKFSRCVFTVR